MVEKYSNKNSNIKNFPFYNTFIDDNQEKLRKLVEKYRTALSSINDMVFEYDSTSEKIRYYKNTLFSDLNIKSDSFNDAVLKLSKICCKEDKKEFFNIFNLKNLKDKLKSGIDKEIVKFRILDKNSKFIWLECTLILVPQSNKQLDSIIGCIKNITTHKTEEEKWKNMAQYDPLTNLYNKAAVHAKIEDIILDSSKKDKHAFFIIDIDYFKNVNDKLGHMFGDELLSGFSNKLSQMIDNNGIVGRFGGDEFIICLKNIDSKQKAKEIAQKILEAFRNFQFRENLKYTISGSIGISLYPEHGNNFKNLFENADKALYFAKTNGRDQYKIFNEEEFKNNEVLFKDNFDTSYQYRRHETITGYILNMLSNCLDIEDGINNALSFVGRYFDVSSSYVMEFLPYNKTLTATFEWYNENSEYMIEKQKDVVCENTEDFFNIFDENGIFYCDSISILPEKLKKYMENKKVCSFLQCIITDCGEKKGYIGFYECRNNRLWVHNEIENLSAAAKIISVFIIKLRLRKKLK